MNSIYDIGGNYKKSLFSLMFYWLFIGYPVTNFRFSFLKGKQESLYDISNIVTPIQRHGNLSLIKIIKITFILFDDIFFQKRELNELAMNQDYAQRVFQVSEKLVNLTEKERKLLWKTHSTRESGSLIGFEFARRKPVMI